MFYIFEWGDGTYNFTDWYDSDETVSRSHNWSEKGYYQVRVKTVDYFGAESPWSDPLSISMPKVKQVNRSLFFQLLERLVYRYPLLSNLIYC